MGLGVQSDVQNRVGGAQAMLRLFDRDRDGAVDAAIFTAADEFATAMVYASLRASHPGVVFDSPGPVPVLIRDLWCRLVIGYAGEMFPGTKDASGVPYAGMKKSAMADLEALATNNKRQLPAMDPQPTGTAVGYVSAPTPVFAAAANGREADPDQTSVNGTGGHYSGF